MGYTGHTWTSYTGAVSRVAAASASVQEALTSRAERKRLPLKEKHMANAQHLADTRDHFGGFS
jgi:hypothetical protein